jgi:CheY-like chemotaxis protein
MQTTSHGCGKKNILIVDEEPSILNLLELALSEQGFTAHCASAPERAIELCKVHPLRIVLADVDFLGKGGLQLLAGIRKLRPAVHICLMTAALPSCTDEDLNVSAWRSASRSLSLFLNSSWPWNSSFPSRRTMEPSRIIRPHINFIEAQDT